MNPDIPPLAQGEQGDGVTPGGTLVLLLTSPRVPVGIMSYAAWARLLGAARVFGREEDTQVAGVMEAGIDVERVPPSGPLALAEHLLVLTAKTDGDVVRVGSADGDPGLPEALSAVLSRPSGPSVVVEMLVGSWDTPGAKVLDLVAVMDRLRSPGGCPWDAEQTHASLVPYLLEEAHEAAEALETGDRDHMIEELGDVLLQVAFQARVGEDDPEAPFTIDDVAAGIVDKLVRRHPHVFSDVSVDSPDQVAENWESIKAAEKPGRAAQGTFAGIPAGMPGLARAEKMLSRLTRAGRLGEAAALRTGHTGSDRLWAAVLELHSEGTDTESALRSVLRELAHIVDGTEGLVDS